MPPHHQWNHFLSLCAKRSSRAGYKPFVEPWTNHVATNYYCYYYYYYYYYYVLMTNEMHNSYNKFLFHSFFGLLYMFRTNLVVHHQEHGIMYRLYCVTQYILPCSWSWTTRFVRNTQSWQKNCGIKIDYKNCKFRWSLTHCNMMHGTHNVKLQGGWEVSRH